MNFESIIELICDNAATSASVSPTINCVQFMSSRVTTHKISTLSVLKARIEATINYCDGDEQPVKMKYLQDLMNLIEQPIKSDFVVVCDMEDATASNPRVVELTHEQFGTVVNYIQQHHQHM